MKKLNQFITEKFRLSKDNLNQSQYQPQTKIELKKLIIKLIEERGNEANLNDIDVSEITDMSMLFRNFTFNGDISLWDVSNVINMSDMFADSEFNGDISGWDVSKVKYMDYMFTCSKFSGDISEWDTHNVTNKLDIFYGCPLEQNPPAWYKE